MHAPPLIFFDGVCNLCNGTVQFLLRRDHKEVFRFASLQSPAATELLADTKSYVGEGENATLVLIEEGRQYEQSTAILRIARHLGGLWTPLARLALFIPRALRDPAYRLLARNRYRLFGKSEQCWIPTPALQQRFISEVAQLTRP